MKIPQSEYTKTNSIYSAMRLAFLKVVKFWIISSACIIFAVVGSAVANAFLASDHQIKLPIGELIGLVATIGGVAFAGKAAQSFSEPDAPEVDTVAQQKSSDAIAAMAAMAASQTPAKTGN